MIKIFKILTPLFIASNLLCTNPETQTFKINNINLIIQKGDITASKTEAIVNAANEQLLGGSGVCGAIFDAAGWQELQDACDKFPKEGNVRCSTGDARITESFNLKNAGINWIIHAVGPDCRIIKDTKEQDTKLRFAYFSSLLLAKQKKIKSIACPFISSAIYAFPKDRAAKIALQAVADFIKWINPYYGNLIESVHFVLFSQEDFDLFCKYAEELVFAK